MAVRGETRAGAETEETTLDQAHVRCRGTLLHHLSADAARIPAGYQLDTTRAAFICNSKRRRRGGRRNALGFVSSARARSAAAAQLAAACSGGCFAARQPAAVGAVARGAAGLLGKPGGVRVRPSARRRLCCRAGSGRRWAVRLHRPRRAGRSVPLPARRGVFRRGLRGMARGFARHRGGARALRVVARQRAARARSAPGCRPGVLALARRQLARTSCAARSRCPPSCAGCAGCVAAPRRRRRARRCRRRCALCGGHSVRFSSSAWAC